MLLGIDVIMDVASVTRSRKISVNGIRWTVRMQSSVISRAATFTFCKARSNVLNALRRNILGNVLPVSARWNGSADHKIKFAKRGSVMIKNLASQLSSLFKIACSASVTGSFFRKNSYMTSRSRRLKLKCRATALSNLYKFSTVHSVR